ncbi:MAG: hypothetical protein ACRDIA_01185 [Actinomycetota bacterium]
MAAGADHSLAITSDGKVFGWGSNQYGQLGSGLDGLSAPLAVPGVGVVPLPGQCVPGSALCGGEVYCADRLCLSSLFVPAVSRTLEVSRDFCLPGILTEICAGRPVCGLPVPGCFGPSWEMPESRIPGLDFSIFPLEAKLPPGTIARSVTAGDGFSGALAGDGRLFTWGANSSGQVGDGSYTRRRSPTPVNIPVSEGEKVEQLAAGGLHMLAVTSRGRAFSWGGNAGGALGNGSQKGSGSPAPVLLPLGSRAFALSAGGNHSVAVVTSTAGIPRPPKVQAEVVCAAGSSARSLVSWGRALPNSLPTVEYRVYRINGSEPADAQLVTVIEADPAIENSATRRYSFEDASAHDGSFGYQVAAANTEGEGPRSAAAWADLSPRPVFSKVDARNQMVRVAWNGPGPSHTAECLAADGFRIYRGLSKDGAKELVATIEPSAGKEKDDFLYFNFSDEGLVNNTTYFYQLGAVRETEIKSEPIAATPQAPVLFGWGANLHGEVGDGGRVDRTAMVASSIPRLPPGVVLVQVAAGARHSLALSSEGKVFAWGAGDRGQLGDGRVLPCRDCRSELPVEVKLPQSVTVTELAAGGDHSAALTEDGRLLAWGANDRGQLGDGTRNDRRSPVEISTGSAGSAAFVAAGRAHTLIVNGNGQVWAVGANDRGQLGNGTLADKTTLVRSGPPTAAGTGPEAPFEKVLAITAGADHNLAIDSNGTVFAWGANSKGQLGDGTLADKPFPGAVAMPPRGDALPTTCTVTCLPDPGYVAVAAGADHSLALGSGHQVLAWGSNQFGQLGIPPAQTPVASVASAAGAVLSPVPLSVNTPGHEAVAVAAGGFHNVVLARSGLALAWGKNDSGQLGIGSTRSTPVPTPVLFTPESRVSKISGELAGALSLGMNSSLMLVDQPPIQLLASGGGKGVHLDWVTPSSDGGALLKGYKIYRGVRPGGEEQAPIAQVGRRNSFLDSSAIGGKAYYYQVAPFNTVGDGGRSNEVEVLSMGSGAPQPLQGIQHTDPELPGGQASELPPSSASHESPAPQAGNAADAGFGSPGYAPLAAGPLGSGAAPPLAPWASAEAPDRPENMPIQLIDKLGRRFPELPPVGASVLLLGIAAAIGAASLAGLQRFERIIEPMRRAKPAR